MAGHGSVLVAGGAGYIGSHACKSLALAVYTPVAFDNLSSGHEYAVRWGPFEQGDVLDRQRLDAVIETHRPAAVMHFAALAEVGAPVRDPGSYYRTNASGSLTLLEAARDHGIGRFVFSSSCATHGVPSQLPFSETSTQQPINPYGVTKLAVERMLADFGVAHGLRSVLLRYFNAVGADPNVEAGEDHAPETHLIPLALDAASGRGEHLTIHGTGHATPDGSCMRDYVHVSDLARAHISALHWLELGAEGGSFNLGNGTAFSVLDVTRTVERVTGLQVAVKAGPARPGDPPVVVSDVTKARDVLHWQTQEGGLENVIRTAWAWHQRLGPFTRKEGVS